MTLAACPAPAWRVPQVPVLREVRLYGVLGARFGRVHRMAISTPHEAVRALSATVDGFAAFLLEQARYGYAVVIDKQPTQALEQLHDPLGQREVVKIVPVIQGAKSRGLTLILGGLLLFFGGPLIGGLINSTGIGGAIALGGMKIGTALILGGIVALLSPQRKHDAAPAAGENTPSYAFDGAVNTTQQGLPVPLVYGRVITGGAVISSGLNADDKSPVPAPPPAPPQTLPVEQPLYPETYDRGA